ncbi:hypothetical protein N7474_004924 [Penicillium riverlandense]|uniref:uncharacterized protein n=1 Tax=Penicillium riverlandense TaxID=1903569 RepID=UPI0025490141|nr:uncharacterized protein N7474_004924 [Penicillium riverlandense]KAJ5819333.1 hypothetical protein N7474_004924 [Penicillium riverlandense]
MILSGIFPGVIGLKPTSCKIISNTFDTCTFSIQFETVPLPDYPKDLIVRLETSRSRLAILATLQRLARSQLNDLVPSVLDVGTTMTAAAKEIEYLVTPYFTGTISLEDVWNTLDQTHQLEVVDSVILAVDKLQKLDLGNLSQSLAGTPYISTNDAPPQPVKIAIGGPALGYFPDVKEFLGGLLQASNQKPPGCKLLEIDCGITLQSAYADIGRIDLSRSDLDELQHHAVFCHNDLEPRNILVRETSSGKYELAGVIDWERAGFFPFSYEYGLKDTILGSSNLYFSWYTMFKTQASHLLPRAECHVKLIKALPDYR